MQTKHLCVLIHISTKGEFGALNPPLKKNLLTVPRRCFFVDIFFVTYVSCLSCFFVYSMQPCGHLLGKGPASWLYLCGVLLCFVTSLCGVLGRVW